MSKNKLRHGWKLNRTHRRKEAEEEEKRSDDGEIKSAGERLLAGWMDRHSVRAGKRYPLGIPCALLKELLRAHPPNAASPPCHLSRALGRQDRCLPPQVERRPAGQRHWRRLDPVAVKAKPLPTTRNTISFQPRLISCRRSKLDTGIMYMSPNSPSLVILIALWRSSVAKMISKWCPFLRQF